jgi:hypothetical protein
MPSTVAAVVVLVALTASAAAHGGVATLQLGTERANPGATIEVIGDMTTAGQVVLTVVSAIDGAAREVATVVSDEDGHFQAFVTLPTDVPGGQATVVASIGQDVVGAQVVIAGSPVASGEEGQLRGQDEAFAGAAPPSGWVAGITPVASPRTLAPASPVAPANVPLTLVVIGVAITSAFAAGAIARRRRPVSARPVRRGS